jgi:2-methylcitrate dehydratase PrpD
VTTRSVTEEIAEFISAALVRPLPAAAEETTKLHLLDTVAAMVSGSGLAAGRAGIGYVRSRTADGPSVVVGEDHGAPEEYAALANAMAAHADESDDTHELSKSHPGCSIVPVALATAVSTNRTGSDMLRAVACGYDVGPRVNMAAWPSFADVRRQRRGTPGISGTFGSASAAAALRQLEPARVRHLLSYVAQQASGMNTWKRDLEHVEKAFVLAGWPAYSAMFAVSVVAFGWTGVDDVFVGDPNFLDIVGSNPHPELLTDELGTRFEVERTHIKKHPVGSPAQAPVQALVAIIERHKLTQQNIAEVVVTIPGVLAHTVQHARSMPDINLPYLLAVLLDDGTVTFAAAHDVERFDAWRTTEPVTPVRVIGDESLEPRRQAHVFVRTVDGRRLEHRVTVVRGSPENPMSRDEVRAKAMDLIAPVVGSSRGRAICDTVLELERIDEIRCLTDLLRGSG